jgi:hypothetical protein
MDTFHWAIFVLHLSAALVITAGVWFRCDQALWVSRMRVDTYAVHEGSTGLWWDTDPRRVERCYNGTGSVACFRDDLPLYEATPAGLGWHLFALLGHFEWVSASFAFFYIRGPWSKWSWMMSSVLSSAGAGLFLLSGRLFINEVVIMTVGLCGSVAVFYLYRDLNTGPSQSRRTTRGWDTDSLHWVRAPVLRFLEYSMTASELYVAVLAVFVIDPPAYMSLGGYALIVLCNLYGAMMHYSVATENVTGELRANLKAPRMGALIVYAPLHTEEVNILPRPWGSFIASNASTMANSWMVYTIAMCLLFYQQTFLFSKDPPVFVVFAGWSLIVFYTSFGVWATALYVLPQSYYGYAGINPYTVLVLGLDVLSIGAKLSIVGALASGFVFQADGRC